MVCEKLPRNTRHLFFSGLLVVMAGCSAGMPGDPCANGCADIADDFDPGPPPAPPAPPASLAVADYTAVSLGGGGGGGDGAMATGINNLGQIVGAITPTFMRDVAVSWTVSESAVVSRQVLGTLAAGNHSRAMGINDLGQVVGWYSDGSDRRPFVWTADGGMLDLGVPTGFPGANAYDINDAGQVAGVIFPRLDGVWEVSFNGRFMVWTVDQRGMPTSEQDMGTLGGEHAAALGINSSGKAAGTSYRDDLLRPTGLIWSASEGILELDGFTEVVAINDFDELAGNSEGRDSGFFWSPADGFMEIPEGIPADLNNSSQVVGTTFSTIDDGIGAASSAFIWETGEAKVLPPPPPTEIGWHSYHATAINDAGWVVGYSAPDWQAIVWIPNTP